MRLKMNVLMYFHLQITKLLREVCCDKALGTPVQSTFNQFVL